MFHIQRNRVPIPLFQISSGIQKHTQVYHWFLYFSIEEMSHFISATAGILIGGQSSRFGSPKWKVKMGGITVLNRLWKACNRFENRIVIGKEQPDDLGKQFLKDELERQAPIIGLHTLLKNSAHEWNLLLSCDLPLITASLLEKIWENRDSEKDIIVPESDAHLQVTCAFYHRRLADTVEAFISNGQLSLYQFVETVECNKVSMPEKQFFNMNAPKDLDTAEKLLRNE